MKKTLFAALTVCTLIGCASLTGKPFDTALAKYGPPTSTAPMGNGGAVYRWSGQSTETTSMVRNLAGQTQLETTKEQCVVMITTDAANNIASHSRKGCQPFERP